MLGVYAGHPRQTMKNQLQSILVTHYSMNLIACMDLPSDLCFYYTKLICCQYWWAFWNMIQYEEILLFCVVSFCISFYVFFLDWFWFSLKFFCFSIGGVNFLEPFFLAFFCLCIFLILGVLGFFFLLNNLPLEIFDNSFLWQLDLDFWLMEDCCCWEPSLIWLFFLMTVGPINS